MRILVAAILAASCISCRTNEPAGGAAGTRPEKEADDTSVRGNVGNMMIHYRHMQRPGMDHLGLRISGGLIGAKCLSSVANQYGMDRRLSDLFGISG